MPEVVFRFTGGGVIAAYPAMTATTASFTLLPPYATTATTSAAALSGNLFMVYDPPLTAGLDARVAGEVAAWDVQQEVRRVEGARAVARATDLLLCLLDPVQAAQYQAEQTFEVIGSHGGRYRIGPGTMANVAALDPVTGAVTGWLCAHPTMRHGALPDPDVALAQMLDLQTDEVGFVRTANLHGGRRPVIAHRAA